jgi:hypothetical protein
MKDKALYVFFIIIIIQLFLIIILSYPKNNGSYQQGRIDGVKEFSVLIIKNLTK